MQQKKYYSERKMLKCIRFIGNMRQNVDQLMQNIDCKCECRNQFRQILLLYAEKIQKLRKQRQAYKNKYYQDVQCLKNQLSTLQQAFYSLQRTQKTDKVDYSIDIHGNNNNSCLFTQNMNGALQQLKKNDNIMPQLYSKESLSINLFANNKTQQEYPTQQKEQSYGNLQNIIKKYNIGPQQLENLVKQYVSQYENQFDNQQQKKLFRLGKKLEKQIWMKKVKKDIEVIVSARSKIDDTQNCQPHKKSKKKSIK